MSPSSAVGVRGHQSLQAALDCLRSAPLLEDLSEWSHWDLVFQPQFGKLSDFLLSKRVLGEAGSCVSALEITSGKLLKICSTSTIQDFNQAVDCFDPVQTSGHLISLVAIRGNTQDISPQLLANHLRSSLEKRAAESSERLKGEKVVSSFIFKCLIRIPVKLCRFLANEVREYACTNQVISQRVTSHFLKI